MSTEEVRQGKTTIAPEVLLTIARLSALGARGVARTSPRSASAASARRTVWRLTR